MRARLAVVAALLLAPAPARAQTAEDLVRALAKQALDGDVTVGNASWSGSALELTDVTLLDADRHVVARLGRVHAELRPLALYGSGTVDAVEIEGVALKLRRLPDGSLGVGRILQKGTSGGGGFAIARARIHGPLVVAAPGRAPATMTVDVAAALERAGASTKLLLRHAVVTLGRTVVGAEGALALDGGVARGKLSGRVGGLAWMPAAATWGWELKLDGDSVRGSVALPHGPLTVDASLAGDGWRAEIGGRDVALEDLVRDGAGRAGGTVRLSANGQSTKVALDATARALRVGEIIAATVELRGEGDLLAKSGSVQLHATGVASGGLAVGDVRIVAGGDRQHVTVEATTTSDRGSAHLEAAGTPSWRDDQPIGVDATLRRLQLDARGQRWVLARPARLQIGRALVLDATTLERHGGAGEQVSLSGRVETRSGRLDVRAVGHRLLLRTIATALGAELALPDVALEVAARARGALGSPRVELTADG
ncbi:MAG: hypothetical protein JWM53_6957, partial [bacterium]|nr:hypothetical protein [bacterium]